MIRKITAGTVILAFALTGCFLEKKEGDALKEADKKMASDIAYIRDRISAAEAVCLQLNDKINNLETKLDRRSDHAGAASSSPAQEAPAGTPAASTAATAAPDAAPAPAAIPESAAPAAAAPAGDPSKPLKLTLGSFSYTIAGMKPETITKMFGKPVKIKKVANSETWIYNQVNLQKDDGSPDPRPAMIVFENGRVARGILTQAVQYDSQLEQPAQPAATNAAAEQPKQ